MAKYKLKNGNIVKSDFEIEYNPKNFVSALESVQQRIKEMEAQNKIYIAKMDNVARNHKHVLKRTDEERNAIWLYQENHIANLEAERIIKELKKGEKAIKKEMEEITEQTKIKFD